jgi:hypothetical protein
MLLFRGRWFRSGMRVPNRNVAGALDAILVAYIARGICEMRQGAANGGLDGNSGDVEGWLVKYSGVMEGNSK